MAFDKLQWCVRAGRLDAPGYAVVVAHVRHWRAKLPAYDLFVPEPDAAVVGIQIYGELVLPFTASERTTSSEITTVLDALDELGRVLPGGAEITVAATSVVYEATAMGFHPRARTPEDILPLDAPITGWIRASTLPDTPSALPVPESFVFTPATRSFEGFPDLDLRNESEARDRVDRMMMQSSVAAILVMCASLRDRPRSDQQQELYDKSVDALGQLGYRGTAPTIVLAMSGRIAGATVRNPEWRDAVARCIYRDERTRAHLLAIADLPGFSEIAAKIIDRPKNDEERFRWLGHPFWRVRVAAIFNLHPEAEDRARAVCSVWHSIIAAGLPVDEKPRSLGSGLKNLELGSDFRALAAPFGGLLPLAPLPSLEEGASSRCADHRAWSRAALGLPAELDPDSLLALSDAGRAALLAAEAEDVASATGTAAAIAEWFTNNKARIEQLVGRTQAPSSDAEDPPK